MFWRNFTETIWFYITLLIHLKRGGSLKKQVRVFAFQRFINMGICQLKELLASEITEPLAFTVGKLEFHGKVIVLQPCFRSTHFRLVVNNNGQNRRKAICNKTKRNSRSNCGSMITRWHRMNISHLLEKTVTEQSMTFGDYDTLMVYWLLSKNLFSPITCAHFSVLFLGNVTLKINFRLVEERKSWQK